MTVTKARQIIGEYICGCGWPSVAMKRLYKYLDMINKRGQIGGPAGVAEAHQGDAWLIAYLLDDLGLIEHDITIKTPQLTTAGKMLLNALSVAAMHNYSFDEMEE